MPLLLIDMLGIKSKWQQGKDAVQVAFDRFEEFVVDGLAASASPPFAGGIDSDAAAFVFESGSDLLRVAARIYSNAFDCEGEDGRYWLRGVVVPYAGEGLRAEQNLAAPFGHLTRAAHSPPLLDAIAVEQSGRIKGMRLLVASSAIDDELREEFKVAVDKKRYLSLFKRLDFSSYPPALNDSEWLDFLWMGLEIDEWEKRSRAVRDKMRFSATDDLEAVR